MAAMGMVDEADDWGGEACRGIRGHGRSLLLPT